MSGDIHAPHFLFKVIMSKLKNWLVTKYLEIEERAVVAITKANFYGNLFTERQKFYFVVFFMALLAFAGAHNAVHFVALVYIMSRMTPNDPDEPSDKQE